MSNTARKLAAIRSRLAEVMELIAAIETEVEEPVSPSVWVETVVAAERFSIPVDSVRRLCRNGFGRKVGGRWQANLTLLRGYFGKRDNRDAPNRVSRVKVGT
ncbi:hypothetical protein LB557_31415 [Mesorhizobium sp. BR115XR7A]|uniref:hypothetical protein n=1 Tax=Mesorhizobium sp. BR115XR7A TaxID=2876645 RepID=UPI001CCD1B24|nr:hypothetical protein [Mesorhizobium sp. BR115XR7A]MBZ9910483.1 hypothetical protein [Mesorhizobium sp. BR115XR7A]MBZ9933466.1 hypothetical protein [Mesorhizobium sp. BR1-1-5]